MNNSSLFDELDLAIDQLIGGGKTSTEPAIAELLEIADDLSHVPDPAFKMKLREHFLQGSAAVRAAEWRQVPAEAAEESDVLPTLCGKGYGVYPVRPANFAASVALHGILALTIGLGLYLMKTAPQVLGPAHTAVVQVGAYVPPTAPDDGGGGGGGDASKSDASTGARPPFANRQITPPVVIIANQKPHLTADATIVGAPQLEVLKSPMGDPLSALVAPSNGRGIHSGIGQGNRGGDGDGDGPGAGPGSGGGIGGGPFSVGRGVSAPRLIYSPDPPYTDEARKAKHQGTVGLWAVVGVDGRPRDLVISSSLGMGLDESALSTVRTWRFEPGTKDGRSVPVWMYVEVNFRLF